MRLRFAAILPLLCLACFAATAKAQGVSSYRSTTYGSGSGGSQARPGGLPSPYSPMSTQGYTSADNPYARGGLYDPYRGNPPYTTGTDASGATDTNNLSSRLNKNRIHAMGSAARRTAGAGNSPRGDFNNNVQCLGGRDPSSGLAPPPRTPNRPLQKNTCGSGSTYTNLAASGASQGSSLESINTGGMSGQSSGLSNGPGGMNASNGRNGQRNKKKKG